MASRFVPGPLIARQGKPEDVISIAFTGGTTGKPKGVLTTNRSSAMVTQVLLAEFEWPDEIRHLICSRSATRARRC